jgi:predicted O-methyltransferase YrrM
MKPASPHPYSPELLTDKKYFWNCSTSEDLLAYREAHMQRVDDDFEALLAILNNEPQLLTMVQTTVPTMDGWCTETKAAALAALVVALKPKTVVEIGVWAGRSLIPMALAMKAKFIKGQVIGIDPYSNQESTKGEFGANQKWWGEVNHELILETFRGFVSRFGLNEIVKLMRQPSDAVEPMPCELLHIDGNHTDQAVKDAERFGSRVKLGGVVVCDDIMWIGGGVLRAIDTLENMGFHEVYRNTPENWNIMVRVSV